MRVYCVAMVAGVLASTGASASSFVTLPAREEAVSPSFVYLGGATPAVAATAAPSAPVQAALHYPAPLSAALEAPAPTAAAPAPPQIALHYPAPMPDGLKTPNASAPMVRVSTSIIAMGEPEIEYFKVAAIAPKAPPKQAPDFSPMVMRGGIMGDAIVRDSGSEEPQPASVKTEPPKPVPRDAPQPTPEPAVAPPPPPPKGMGPLRGVQ